MEHTVVIHYLFWLGLWAALSRSPFMQTVFELFITKSPMTRADIESYLMVTGRFNLLQLWLCPWCQAFWISLAFSATVACATDGLCGWAFIAKVLIGTFAAYPLFLLPVHYLWKK